MSTSTPGDLEARACLRQGRGTQVDGKPRGRFSTPRQHLR